MYKCDAIKSIFNTIDSLINFKGAIDFHNIPLSIAFYETDNTIS